MLETLRSYWSIISTIITVVAVPAVGYLYKKYKQADARQRLRNLIWMLFTIQYMKWLVTRPAMAAASRVC